MPEIDKYIIEQYFSTPNSYWREDEYYTLNPLRLDKNIGSFHISASKGCYIDHATSEGGSIIDLFVNKGFTKKEACRIVYGESFPQSLESNIFYYDEWYDENLKFLGLRLVRNRNVTENKQFIWQHSKDNGATWEKGKNGIQPTLYNLHKVVPSKIVFFCEGEGNAECVQNICIHSDYSATTSGGAESWTNKIEAQSISFLKDKTVYIFPDNDDAGSKFSQKVLKSLRKAKIDSYIVELPGLKELAIIKNGKLISEKQDVKNWIESGKSFEDLISACNIEKQKSEEFENSDSSLTWKNIKKLTIGMDKFTALDLVFEHIYKKRYNVVLNRAEIRKLDSEEWLPVTDRLFLTIWKEINQNLNDSIGLIKKDILEASMESISGNDYDPFIDWTQNIPVIEVKEGEESELEKFLSYFVLEKPEQSHLFQKVIRRWLVATYSLLAKRTKHNEICPVLSGKQGIGKNRFLDKLFETIPREYFYTGAIQADNKDSRKRVATMAVIHLDEFDSTTGKSDTSSLKSLITSKEFTDRLPYGRLDTQLERRCSFIASINTDTSILMDDSGNRRFPTFRLKSIMLNELLLLDTVKIWGEIKFITEIIQEPTTFSEEEVRMFEEINEEFRKIEAFEEYVDEFFSNKQDVNFDTKEILGASEIIDQIESETVKRLLTIDKVGKIMKKKGFFQMREKGVRKYLIYKKSKIDNSLQQKLESKHSREIKSLESNCQMGLAI
ncbi:toprim domain-containing protein [Leptospira sp. 2 VSF19]|uniref:Toprim domain-containing protein n=1 Tax=Leptospira soteropolitanensis TaxID=2950025 RepID=A0AAW5VL01_9LEPT|nr:VapE domain-containing protein [Leptospira soteropolitanensis]MCW7494663.1 toprim domain-containing protein [Leptospira soteropolitanensis]MCW7500001.1 toprim domain-containing protein [Leptospira soteropolitanensis]MCW7522252.1 toprim domain-containing protein [Leptospira soteropolitanensis]MCW7526108.1 toprim domain-containing protein [Leptospira soteropolitanensis]MCW7529780.1 toprim domain-containing protein [Leptospira soteropolitanensis]